jgi:hypothetical protein
MIWLLPHPLPSPPVGKLTLLLSLPVCRRSTLLTGVGGRGESLVLFESFNTLWQIRIPNPFYRILT